MRSAWEEILASVCRALGAVETEDAPVRGAPSVRPEGGVVQMFGDQVADYRGSVTRHLPAKVADRIRDALGMATSVVVPDEFLYDVTHLGSEGHPGQLAATGQSASVPDIVVTEATVGIAATGTTELSHDAGEGRRALSPVPDLHVCVVREGQVVAGVPDAVPCWTRRAQTWTSGPSATSDIELDHVGGARGANNLQAIVVSGR